MILKSRVLFSLFASSFVIQSGRAFANALSENYRASTRRCDTSNSSPDSRSLSAFRRMPRASISASLSGRRWRYGLHWWHWHRRFKMSMCSVLNLSALNVWRHMRHSDINSGPLRTASTTTRRSSVNRCWQPPATVALHVFCNCRSI